MLRRRLDVNMGSIVENAVANGFALRYFDRKNLGELDFVVQKGLTAPPLEVNSGKNYRRHPVLNNTLQNADWQLGRRSCSAQTT